jgi:GT2 family glycosyltransferase
MLERMVEYAEAHPKCGLLSPLIYQAEHPERFWVVGGIWKLYAVAMEGWDTPDTGQYVAPTPFDIVFGTALLMKRSVLERIGLFDERFFVYYEDVDFGLRARRAGYDAAVIPEARIWHSGSSSTRRQRYLKEFYLARSRILLFRKHLPGIHFLIFMLLQIREDLIVYRGFLRHGELFNLADSISGSISGLCELRSWQEGRRTHEFQTNHA